MRTHAKGKLSSVKGSGALSQGVRLVDGNGVSTNVGLLQVRTDDPQVAEFGTVCGMNLANIFGCCLCSNMWLTVVCFCRQLLMSCVCNWVTTLVLSARPRVIATAAAIYGVPLAPQSRCPVWHARAVSWISSIVCFLHHTRRALHTHMIQSSGV